MDNRTIARKLLEYAGSQQGREPNLYRLRAYRRAASLLLTLARPVTELVAEGGRAALERVPGIGAHLAYTIAELVRTGEFRTWVQRQAESHN